MTSRLSSVGTNARGLAVSNATTSGHTVWRGLVLLGTPLALAIMEIFHPQPSGAGESIEQGGHLHSACSVHVEGVFSDVRQLDAHPRLSVDLSASSHRTPSAPAGWRYGAAEKTRYPNPVVLLVCRLSRRHRVPSGPNQ